MLDYTFAGQFAQNPRLSCLNRPGPPAWWYYTFGASRVVMRQGSVVYYSFSEKDFE
ncbi:MAG: hypothetical protein HC875_40565 [Anaerolineales bacterium]|nr:hypothetical protein [Anaerolineales bacterium]